MKGAALLVAAAVAVSLLTGCSPSSDTSTRAPPTASHHAAHRPALVSTLHPRAAAGGRHTCHRGPDVLYWEHDPGRLPYAVRLGPYSWYAAGHRCMPTAEYALLSAPNVAGICVQIALLSANPGYQVDAVPAARLYGLTASFGRGC